MSKLYDAHASFMANAGRLMTCAELRMQAEQDVAAEFVAAKAAAFDARRKMDQLPKTPTRAEVTLAVGVRMTEQEWRTVQAVLTWMATRNNT